jgi:hypothetical protein
VKVTVSPTNALVALIVKQGMGSFSQREKIALQKTTDNNLKYFFNTALLFYKV